MINYLRKRQSIFFAIKIIVTLFIFWLLTYHSQLKFELFASVFAKPMFAFGIMALFYVSVILNSWRWYRLNAAQDIKLSFSQSIMPTYVGIAFNNVLPGSVGGDFVRCFYVLKKFPEQKSGAIFSIFLDRACGLMGIIVTACMMALFHFDTFSHNSNLSGLFFVCAGITGIGITLFCFSMLLPEKIGLSQWLHNKFAHFRWFQPVISILEAVRVYRKSKLIILECLIVSILNQLLLLGAILLINRMMGLQDVPASDYMIALAVGQVANLIPLTPGGLGIGEAAFANIVTILNPGVVGAYATVFFAFRLLITLAYLPGVIVGVFGLKLKKKIIAVQTVVT